MKAKENKPTLEELGLTEEDFIVTPWDIAEFLDSPEMITTYLKESLATGNKDIIRQCISDIIRAKGMIQIEKETGLSREKLANPDSFTAEISHAFNCA